MDDGREGADLSIGTAVTVPADGICGRTCSSRATLGFEDGIYCVEHETAAGESRRDWFRAADIKRKDG